MCFLLQYFVAIYFCTCSIFSVALMHLPHRILSILPTPLPAVTVYHIIRSAVEKFGLNVNEPKRNPCETFD